MFCIPSSKNSLKAPNFELIFLVGFGRSGTTWLQNLITTAPLVASGPETGIFKLLRPYLNIYEDAKKTNTSKGLHTYLSEKEFLKNTRIYIQSLFGKVVQQKKANYFLEKTPDHGWYLPEINRVFPHSKFIHLIRDGRDVACSLFAISKKWIDGGWEDAPKTICEASDMWIEYMNKVRAKGKELGCLYKEFFYEKLVDNPIEELESIYKFLGLKINNKLLVDGIKKVNQISKIKTSTGTWKKQFTAEEKAYFKNRGNNLLIDLGYELNNEW